MESDKKHRRPPALVVAVGVAFIVALIVMAFSWPGIVAEPKDVPVAIAGPEAQTGQMLTAIEASSGGALEISQVENRDEAVQAIEQREIYGAIVIGESPEVVIATAANPAISQMLAGMVGSLQGQLPEGAPQVVVTDVVPFLDDDPRGSGLTAATLPLILGGLIGGVAISATAIGWKNRSIALATYALSAALLVTAILQGWWGVLDGNWMLNTLAFTASLLAVGSIVVGSVALLGNAGVAVGPVLFMLFANPIGGVMVPKEFLPAPWGTIGQLFPPGAGASLLRSISYFPNASTLMPWIVLIGWAAIGFGMMILGDRRETAV